MASTVDGKISTYEHVKVRFGSARDRTRLEEIRSAADAVVLGRKTLVLEDPPLLLRRPEISARYLAERGRPHPINVAVCSRLDFDPEGMAFFNHPDTERVVVTTQAAQADACERFARFARVIQVPADAEGQVDLAATAEALVEAGIHDLVLEGGGQLNFSMFAAGLVDEMYLTICPFVFGGTGASTPVDGAGFSKETARRLELIDVEPGEAGEVFVHYRVSERPTDVRPSQMFQGAFRVA